MFRENSGHLQKGLYETTENLPEKIRKKLEDSWAYDFYHDLFCKIDESVFKDIYSIGPSRPNYPVNIFLGLEILKSGFGWSDEEMYNAFLFNLQVRYSLGIRDINAQVFELRSIYNFRKRLSDYMQETGKNPLDIIFNKITDKQLEKYGIKTETQRMDSTLIGSNIRNMSRLQLLVEVLIRTWRILDDQDKDFYKQEFESFLKGSAVQYCYKVKRDQVGSRLETIGNLMDKLITELAKKYWDHPTYQILLRAFDDHFELTSEKDGSREKVNIKEKEELKADSMQSPDDLEATYRNKRKESSKGYVGNITETCHEENDFQLVVKAQVASNITDDQDLLVEAIPELKERTDLQELDTDGGYTGPKAIEIMEENDVKHIPTAIRGRQPSKDQFDLSNFNVQTDEAGNPIEVKCPGEQTAEVKPGRKQGRYIAGFDKSRCATCPLVSQCPCKDLKKKPLKVLRFSDIELKTAALRKTSKKARKDGNRRAAVESTIRSIIHPFGGHLCKLPVRGIWRVTQMIIYGAFMVNIRRIARAKSGYSRANCPLSHFFLSIGKFMEHFLRIIEISWIFSHLMYEI